RSCGHGVRLRSPSAFGHNDHPHIFRVPNDLQNEIRAKQTRPPSEVRTAEKNLGDLIPARKFNQSPRSIRSLKYSGFNVEIARKVQVLVDSLALFLGQVRNLLLGTDVDCKAVGAEIVSHSAPPADEH